MQPDTSLADLGTDPLMDPVLTGVLTDLEQAADRIQEAVGGVTGLLADGWTTNPVSGAEDPRLLDVARAVGELQDAARAISRRGVFAEIHATLASAITSGALELYRTDDAREGQTHG